jgi:hypothetical protein
MLKNFLDFKRKSFLIRMFQECQIDKKSFVTKSSGKSLFEVL